RALMLHVCNHGSHHRAQAVNMLRHVGGDVPKPGADYVFMRIEKGPQPSVPIDVRTIRAYYAYADWAKERVHDAAAKLNDARLDRPCEMGLGSLRKTLVHIRDAEKWWLDNWVEGPGCELPPTDDKLPISELRRNFVDVARARNAMLERMSDADLTRMVK